MGVFLVLVGPFSLNFHFHYPDEMYYTDASLQMLKNGDYFTTYLGDGSLRFKKPIMTYWAVLTGFKLFGVSAFSSRIIFLLLGTGLIGLTYVLAKTATNDKTIASCSAWITAAQPLVIFSSSRSIPDILLVFCLTLSAIGITGILNNADSPQKKYLWMFYLGLGFGFAVKGLPALALGGVALLYLIANPWARIKLGNLLHVPSIAIAAAIGLFWFVMMYLEFGPAYLNSFFDDQVGVRVGSKTSLAIKHFLFGCGVLVALFLPWIFLIRKGNRPIWSQTIKTYLPFMGFAAAWLVAIIIMTAFVSVFYERYLLPVYPLVAVAFCCLFLRESDFNKSKTAKFLAILFASINALFLAVGLFMNLGLGSPRHLIVQWAIGLLFVFVLLFMIRRQKTNIALLSFSIMLFFFNGTLVSYPLSIPHQGTQVNDLLEEKNIPVETELGFIGNPHHSSKIRIGLDLDNDLINLDPNKSDWMEYDYLICNEESISQLNLGADAQVEIASLNWDPKYLIAIWESILEGDTSERRYELSKKYYLLTR